MKNKIISFVLCAIFAAHFLIAEEYPMSQLKQIADGLNIEGGTIPHRYLLPGQIWSNICVVLDRPFEDGQELMGLTQQNTYPLKEASIVDYNEAQVNYVFTSMLLYYIQNAHKIADVPLSQKAKVLIQLHRNSSGPKHVELLEQLFQSCYRGEYHRYAPKASPYEICVYEFPHLNVEASFCFGSDPDKLGSLGRYHQVDIVLSLSLVSGFHPDWKSGSFFIPHEHIPFSLGTATISMKDKYFVLNNLFQVLPEIIKDQDEGVRQIVNEKFLSLNPGKQTLRAEKMTLSQFKEAVLLQVDGNFNPSELPPQFKL
jgi:hypothetical protein